MEDEPACTDEIHVFPVDPEWWATPGETRCVCGEVTWQEMDDIRTLTLMWGAS